MFVKKQRLAVAHNAKTLVRDLIAHKVPQNYLTLAKSFERHRTPPTGRTDKNGNLIFVTTKSGQGE